jgi:hypothetical protein
MCTGFTRDTNQYFAKPSPVEVDDYIEFLAEIDPARQRLDGEHRLRRPGRRADLLPPDRGEIENPGRGGLRGGGVGRARR